MQAEFSGGKFFFYKRKGFEVVQRYADGGLFAESAAFFMIKMAVGGLEFGVFDDIDPVVDKRMVVLRSSTRALMPPQCEWPRMTISSTCK